MANWQVQEAKTRLSELIEEADKKGPQIITRHGSSTPWCSRSLTIAH